MDVDVDGVVPPVVVADVVGVDVVPDAVCCCTAGCRGRCWRDVVPADV